MSGSTILNYIDSPGLAGEDNVISAGQNYDKLLAGKVKYMLFHDIAILSEFKNDTYKIKLKMNHVVLKSEKMKIVSSLHPEKKN